MSGGAVAGCELIPGSVVDPGREVASRFKVGYHNTILSLCSDGNLLPRPRATTGNHRDDPGTPPVGIHDPKHEYLVALGRRSDVDVLVSGDGDLLEAELDGLKVLRPAEFVEMLSASEPQA